MCQNDIFYRTSTTDLHLILLIHLILKLVVKIPVVMLLNLLILTKSEENEKLIIQLINQIQNPELQ